MFPTAEETVIESKENKNNNLKEEENKNEQQQNRKHQKVSRHNSKGSKCIRHLNESGSNNNIRSSNHYLLLFKAD
jgi:hypothetical protein